MISWHKVGQKVVLIDGKDCWDNPVWHHSGKIAPRSAATPVLGEVYTIREIYLGRTGNILFCFSELHHLDGWGAKWFRPIYPQVIDRLRSLDTPLPVTERVGEDA